MRCDTSASSTSILHNPTHRTGSFRRRSRRNRRTTLISRRVKISILDKSITSHNDDFKVLSGLTNIGSSRVINAITPERAFKIRHALGVWAKIAPDGGGGAVVLGGVDAGVAFDVEVEAVASRYFVAFCGAG